MVHEEKLTPKNNFRQNRCNGAAIAKALRANIFRIISSFHGYRFSPKLGRTREFVSIWIT